jgi:hypothetical protein
VITAHLLKKAAYTHHSARTCAVTLTQQFGSVLKQGHKVFTLLTISVREEDDWFAQVAKVAGYGLHAGVAARPGSDRR